MIKKIINWRKLISASFSNVKNISNIFPVDINVQTNDSSLDLLRLNPKTDFVVANQYNHKQSTPFLIGKIYRIQQILQNGHNYLEKNVKIAGWVKSARLQGSSKFLFLELLDGSSVLPLQIVVFDTVKNWQQVKKLRTGCSIQVVGKLVPSEGKNQQFEIKINNQPQNNIKIVGLVQDKYPLAAKYHKIETLRDIAHLRPRTAIIAAIARIKNNLSYSTHHFFQNNGFLYVHTPIITTSDCEGAGQMFQVTSLLPQSGKIKDIPATQNGKINYQNDFFKKKAGLTVSGQLSVENYCCSLGNVYTFGPTFRAEQSNTTRHAAQFWMIEPQLAFADLSDAIDCAQSYIKYVVNYILKNNESDMKWLAKLKPNLISYLTNLCSENFARASYDKAIQILKEVESKGVVFTRSVNWGMDLGSQHQRYLCQYIFKKPTVIFNYPKGVKAFYMRLNDDKKTVASFDILVPQIGQIIGGSQRQQRLDILQNRMTELNLEKQIYWWYLDLRRYGSIPHAGFGVGFERLTMMCTGIENIRDILAFPRVPGNANF